MSRILDFSDSFTSATEPVVSGFPAANVTNTPSGNLAATNQQAANNELQSDIDTRVPKVTSTDNAVTRFDGTTGLVQNSGVIVSDTNDVTIPGNLTVNGTTVTLNTATLDVVDQNLTINKGGNDATSTGAGLTVDRTSTKGSLIFDASHASKWKAGLLGAEVQLADVSSTQTFTNKTLTSPAISSPTGLVKADVGLGNVDNTSDATKNAATATLANKTLTAPVISTIVNTGTITLPTATGTLATLAGTEALTNKDINGGTASNTSRLTVPKAAKATLDALTRKEATIVYATDTAKAYVDNGTTLVPIGSGAGGGINYASANSDAETDTAGFATYKDAAGALPVDGTGGSPTFTITRTTTTPLRSTGSFLLTHAATNQQGEGASYAITIDRADRGQQLSISFDYEIASGTYDSGLHMYVYDVTNAVVIQPQGYQVQNAGVNSRHAGCTFQAASNSTSYRVCWHVATTTTTAYALEFDNLVVGPQSVSIGVQAKPSTLQRFTSGSGTYVPPAGVSHIIVKMVGGGGGGGGSPQGGGGTGTAGGSTTFGSSFLTAAGGGAGSVGGGGGTGGSATVNGTVAWSQTWPGNVGGSSISERGSDDQAGGFGGSSVLYGGGGPPGVSGGGSYAGLANTGGGGGGGNVVSVTATPGSGGGAGASIIAQINSPASFAYTIGTGGNGGGGTYPGGAGGSGYIEVTEFYYGNNVLISDSAASRVVSLNTGAVLPTSSMTTGTFQTITMAALAAAGKDTHGSFTPTTGQYLVSVPGTYAWQANLEITRTSGAVTNASTMRMYNSTRGVASGGVPYIWITAGGELAGIGGAGQIEASAGDVLVFQTYHSGGTGYAWANSINASNLALNLIQGPAQIQAATVVAVDADSPTSTHTATAAYMTGFTKRLDTTGSFNAATGIFTAPGPGFYSYTAMYSPQNTALPSSIYPVKNGSILFGNRRGSANSSGTVYPSPAASGIVQLNTGETLGFFAQNSSGSAVVTDSGSCISIFRISGIN